MKRSNEGSSSEPAPRKRTARKHSDAPPSEFSRLKLNGTVYNVGEVAVIKEYFDDCCFGTIVKIWCKANGEAIIRVRWYYKPSDVFKSVPGFIGTDELFDSDHEQDVCAEALYDKAQVLSFTDYSSRPEIDENIYFSRARFLPSTRQLDPPIETWPTVCTCKAIQTPNDVYVECEQCGGLYHFSCVNLSMEKVDKDWICRRCRK